jgi:site-specific DNA recombinase
MNGVIYARYSSDNQREESIEGQLRECNDFAKRNDITIVDSYIDERSPLLLTSVLRFKK